MRRDRYYVPSDEVVRTRFSAIFSSLLFLVLVLVCPSDDVVHTLFLIHLLFSVSVSESITALVNAAVTQYCTFTSVYCTIIISSFLPSSPLLSSPLLSSPLLSSPLLSSPLLSSPLLSSPLLSSSLFFSFVSCFCVPVGKSFKSLNFFFGLSSLLSCSSILLYSLLYSISVSTNAISMSNFITISTVYILLSYQ
jgi:hypothetical protein